MKKIIFRSPREDLEFEKLRGERTLFILPSQSAINFYIRDMLGRGMDINKTEFETFDGIGRRNRAKRPDSVLKYLVLSKILKENLSDLKIFPETVDIILDFFDDIAENYLDSSDIEKIPGKIFKDLARVFDIYRDYFAARSLDIYGRVKEEAIRGTRFDTIIISGFLEFGKAEEEIIKILSGLDGKNIFIDIPFNFMESDLLDGLIKNLQGLGFELEKREGLDYKKDIDREKIKILSSKDNFYNLFFSNVKLLLKEEKVSDLTILSRSPSLSEKIRQREAFEGLEFNLPRKERSLLEREFVTLLDYFLDKSKENTLKRVRLSYFPLPLDVINLEASLMAYNFKNLGDIDFSRVKDLRLNEGELDDFLSGVQLLQEEKISIKEEVTYYVEFFKNYLETASGKIENDLKRNPESPRRRDGRFLEELDEVLIKMEGLGGFYESLDLDDFVLILKKYMEKIRLDEVQNLEGLEISSQASNYYRNFKNLILIGFDHTYQEDKRANFIYKKETQGAMEDLGLVRDNFKRDYFYLIYDLLVAENTLILTGDRERGFSKVLNSLIFDLDLDIEEAEKIYETGRLYRTREVKDHNYIIDDKELGEINKKISERPYSVTDFDILKDCPRRFLFERVYRIGKLEKDYEDRFYLDLGEKYHRVLEKYFKKEDDFNEDSLLKIILEVENLGDFDDLFFLDKVSVLNSQRILGDYIKKDLEGQAKYGYKPAYFEEGFETEIAGLKIRGRIDRIDALGDNEILMDYKRSSVKKKKEIEELKSFQMPLYAIGRKKLGKNISMAAYGSVKRGEVSTVIKNSDILPKDDRGQYYFTEEDLNELLNKFEDEIGRLASSIRSGDYESSSDCKNCDYLEICENKENFNG
ncbi:PD-(D/E)XK nuclease family protein [Peptoniphilus harei]|uniref:PD-(D/E)XK nuclease family protein n=1 Tax=Peptoniphilus harei TaxID=54005 RepID=UPI002915BC2E|nr:PD-(D/E)XK nuclease family protein [Peptoniphilus harei]MDU5418047.1 PD-(D/E)XK nuclease family protein [Peptoniphilus harei]